MGQLFSHLFLPHHSNNHRPRVLHVDALLVYVLFFALISLGLEFGHKAAPDVLGYATDIHAEQLLADTNAKRQEAGLAPLQLNSVLSQAAAMKAQDMFAKGYWAHNSPDGRKPWDFILAAGYKYSVAGENLAKNFSNSDGVVDAWMNSPSHRDNLLKPNYRDIGFAVVDGKLNGEETTLVVQMFGASTQPLISAGTNPGIVKNVSAQEPVPTASAPAAIAQQQPAVPSPTLVISQTASQTETMVQKSAIPLAFSASYRSPLIDIPTVTRMLAFVFIGFLLGVFAVDAFLVSKRHIVRASGHSLTHVLFFALLLGLLIMTLPGSIV
jgi:hypothetical protein